MNYYSDFDDHLDCTGRGVKVKPFNIYKNMDSTARVLQAEREIKIKAAISRIKQAKHDVECIRELSANEAVMFTNLMISLTESI